MLPDTRISIPLSNDEFAALTRLAVREMRDPRDQARYLLRSALLSNDSQINSSTVIRQDTGAAVRVNP